VISSSKPGPQKKLLSEQESMPTANGSKEKILDIIGTKTNFAAARPRNNESPNKLERKGGQKKKKNWGEKRTKNPPIQKKPKKQDERIHQNSNKLFLNSDGHQPPRKQRSSGKNGSKKSRLLSTD